ncbi:MAG TPA: SDR family NAD(P)-dependent oxidoreductase [Dongiaceae bacterium]|nr:SDR family NAD(P)-dependent oxidoreductase [Dongiaceae bacterium]
MSARLSGRTAVLIGAAVGIGRGIAQRLVEDGAQLVVGDVNEAEGRALMRSLDLDPAQFMKVDVSSERDCKALADLAVARFGKIDILVQNAGIYPVALIDEATVEHWDHVMAVNLRGAFVSTKACTPFMRSNGWGRVIFTSSITGPRVVSHGLSAYAATKAGINGFIKVAALEFATHGITVNGVEPGNILTEGLQSGRSPQFIDSMRRSIPMGRLGTPRDIANAVCFLASDDAGYITGTTIVVDGGQTLPENKDFFDPSTWS